MFYGCLGEGTRNFWAELCKGREDLCLKPGWMSEFCQIGYIWWMEALPVGLVLKTHTHKTKHKHPRPKHKTQNSWLYRSQNSYSPATDSWLTLALFILGVRLCLSMFGYAGSKREMCLDKLWSVAGLWALLDGMRVSVNGWNLITVKGWERMRKRGCPDRNESTVTVEKPPSKQHLDGTPICHVGKQQLILAEGQQYDLLPVQSGLPHPISLTKMVYKVKTRSNKWQSSWSTIYTILKQLKIMNQLFSHLIYVSLVLHAR